MATLHTLALGMPGMWEWIVIGGLGLLIFGKRLPEVGRGLGQAITNFKRGLKEGESEAAREETETPPKAIADQSDRGAAAPKFDPYTGKPVEQERQEVSSGH